MADPLQLDKQILDELYQQLNQQFSKPTSDYSKLFPQPAAAPLPAPSTQAEPMRGRGTSTMGTGIPEVLNDFNTPLGPRGIQVRPAPVNATTPQPPKPAPAPATPTTPRAPTSRAPRPVAAAPAALLNPELQKQLNALNAERERIYGDYNVTPSMTGFPIGIQGGKNYGLQYYFPESNTQRSGTFAPQDAQRLTELDMAYAAIQEQLNPKAWQAPIQAIKGNEMYTSQYNPELGARQFVAHNPVSARNAEITNLLREGLPRPLVEQMLQNFGGEEAQRVAGQYDVARQRIQDQTSRATAGIAAGAQRYAADADNEQARYLRKLFVDALNPDAAISSPARQQIDLLTQYNVSSKPSRGSGSGQPYREAESGNFIGPSQLSYDQSTGTYRLSLPRPPGQRVAIEGLNQDYVVGKDGYSLQVLTPTGPGVK